MSQQARFQAIKGDECDCGRRASIRHCPSCGSARLYAYAHPEYHNPLGGELRLVDKLFRCIGCGHRFIDEERQFCEAPPFALAQARRKIQQLAEAKAKGEYLRPEDQKTADAISAVIESNKNGQQEAKIETIEDLEKAVGPQVVDEVNAMPQQSEDFVPPATLTREEYNRAERAFRLEWVSMKLHGTAPTASADEYVERRLKGEIFQ